MSKIKSIHAHEIIDSRSFPTIEGVLILDNGQEIVTSIPSGTSIGKFEAFELRQQQNGIHVFGGRRQGLKVL